jgi:type VI secretion system protein ImpH
VRNADGLRALLQSFFEVPLRIEQLVGHWMAVPVAARSRLGGPDAQLGVSALAGTRVWQAQHKIRLVAGPLDYDDYCRLLPGGASLARLGAWVRDYVGPAIDWDLRMTLKPAQIPPLRLGTRQGNCTGLSSGTRLGWTTWLGRRAAGNDTHAPTAHALLLRPAACQAPSS